MKTILTSKQVKLLTGYCCKSSPIDCTFIRLHYKRVGRNKWIKRNKPKSGNDYFGAAGDWWFNHK